MTVIMQGSCTLDSAVCAEYGQSVGSAATATDNQTVRR